MYKKKSGEIKILVTHTRIIMIKIRYGEKCNHTRENNDNKKLKRELIS